MVTINQQNQKVMSEAINPNTGRSDAQVYRESQAVADRARAMLASMNTATSSGGGITSDSRAAVSSERTIESNIRDLRDRAGLGGDISSYVDPLYSLQRQQEAEIARQREALERRRADEVAGIHAGFDVVKADTELAQKRETGATSMDLARAGGYLGVTASQSGVMQNLVMLQRQEMLALEAKKNEAIRAANNAYEDRDFELAKELLASARDLEKQVFDRRNQFLDSQLKIMGEERAQKQEQRLTDQFKYNMASDRIDRLMDSGVDPGPDDVFRLSQELGISPNEVQRLVTASKNTKELEQKESKTRLDVAIASAINQTPRDSFITIDGVTYRGNGLLPQAGGSTAAERKEAREQELWFQFVQDIRGDEANGIPPMPYDEAIKTYPDLGIKNISDFYTNMRSFENQQELNKKLESGEWDVALTYSNTGVAQTPVVYDKSSWEEAIRQRSAEDTKGFFLGKVTGSDDFAFQVVIDGQSYWLKGDTKNPESLPVGLRQRDFAIPGQTTIDKPSITDQR